MKVIITGGAGFIGSRLAIKLLELKHSVVVIDNLSNGSLENVSSVLLHSRFTMLIEDVLNPEEWSNFVSPGDTIVHLANLSTSFVSDPERILNENVNATEILLEIARTKKCKLLYGSSAAVYGNSEKLYMKEDDVLKVSVLEGCKSAQALSKLTSELKCLTYQEQHDVPVMVCRFFNVIGEHQKAESGAVVPAFIHSIMKGNPVTIYGDGNQSRSFCYVDDAVGAIISLLECGIAWGNIFNVGSDTAVSIRELANYIIDRMGRHSEIEYKLDFKDRAGKIESYSRRASLKKIYQYTKWLPVHSWQEAVDIVISSKLDKLQPEPAL